MTKVRKDKISEAMSFKELKELMKDVHNPFQFLLAAIFFIQIKRQKEALRFIMIAQFILNMFLIIKYTTWLEIIFKAVVNLVMWSIGR